MWVAGYCYHCFCLYKFSYPDHFFSFINYGRKIKNVFIMLVGFKVVLCTIFYAKLLYIFEDCQINIVEWQINDNAICKNLSKYEDCPTLFISLRSNASKSSVYFHLYPTVLLKQYFKMKLNIFVTKYTPDI